MAQVPLIDIGPFLNGGQDAKQAVAKTLDEACRKIGFLIVEGHGVSEDLIAEVHEVSEEYFALPLWEKCGSKCHRIATVVIPPWAPRGSHSVSAMKHRPISKSHSV